MEKRTKFLFHEVDFNAMKDFVNQSAVLMAGSSTKRLWAELNVTQGVGYRIEKWDERDRKFARMQFETDLAVAVQAYNDLP